MPRQEPFAAAPEAILTERANRADRLVAVAAQQISEHGIAGASARSVAAAAGVAASAINYNFGGIEHLFSTSFEQGAAQTADWLAARRHELQALPRSPEGLARALEHLVTTWTGGARPLALLYQECLTALPGRSPAVAWTALWRDFWVQIAADFGEGEVEGRLLHLFFEAEGLYHLSRWSPALEAAALREFVDHFGAIWLGAAAAAPIGVVALAERSAGALAYGSIPPAAMKIAEAAAEVVEGGLGGLTHRAVAARAGVTTGAVTHHFRTIEALVAGAIRGQVQLMATPESDDTPMPQRAGASASVEDFFRLMRPYALADDTLSSVLRRRNLFLAAIRRPELAGCGALIRFAHGGTTRSSFIRVFDVSPEALPLHAGALSRALSVMWFATAADPAPRESRRWLFDEITARMARRVPARPEI